MEKEFMQHRLGNDSVILFYIFDIWPGMQQEWQKLPTVISGEVWLALFPSSKIHVIRPFI